MPEQTRDVAIIGGGPAGLTAGLYLCRAKIDTILLEQQLTGGQAVNSPLIENYPGFPEGISGVELVERMKQQADRFGLEVKTFSKAMKLILDDQVKVISLEDGEIRARSVIVTSGRSPRKMGIPGEDTYTGRGISYCATCDAPLFKDKVVMVIGGGDAAVEEALHLARFASKVILVHRRDQLRASDYLQERAQSEPKLEFMWNSEVTEIIGDDVVKSASVFNNVTSERTEVPVSGIFFYVGNVPNTDFLVDVVELDETGYVVTDNNLESSVPGIFAAGDVRANRFKQVIVAAAEGALASAGAQKFLESVGARQAYEGGH
ncbi:MAG TPA: thioredoxin-disulfide reductase [Candidatus Anoxymicrobiaceae bacterium]